MVEASNGIICAHLEVVKAVDLRENIAATNIKPPADAVDELDRIGAR